MGPSISLLNVLGFEQFTTADTMCVLPDVVKDVSCLLAPRAVKSEHFAMAEGKRLESEASVKAVERYILSENGDVQDS